MAFYPVSVPTKRTTQPWEKYNTDTLYLDYNWTTVINALSPVTISSIAVTVGAGATLDNIPAIDESGILRVVITGGTAGNSYSVKLDATLSDGNHWINVDSVNVVAE